MKKDVIEIKAIGNDYIIIQRDGKGLVKRIVGKMRNDKHKNSYTLLKQR